MPRPAPSGISAKQILAVAVLLAASILAWQIRGIIMVLPRMAPAHDPGGTSVMLPGVITLNMGGDKFVCKLAGTAYSCTIPPAFYTVAGAR